MKNCITHNLLRIVNISQKLDKLALSISGFFSIMMIGERI